MLPSSKANAGDASPDNEHGYALEARGGGHGNAVLRADHRPSARVDDARHEHAYAHVLAAHGYARVHVAPTRGTRGQ